MPVDTWNTGEANPHIHDKLIFDIYQGNSLVEKSTNGADYPFGRKLRLI